MCCRVARLPSALVKLDGPLALAFPCFSSRPAQPMAPIADVRVTQRARAKPPRALPAVQEIRAPGAVAFPIDWSGYAAPRAWRTEDDALRGLLHYAFFHSGGRHNAGEVRVEASAVAAAADASVLFDRRRYAAFDFSAGATACLVLTLPRVRVRPTLLAQRWPPRPQRGVAPASFVFEGWDERAGRWVPLVEKQLPVGPPCDLQSYLHHAETIDTEMEFSRFRFVATDRLPPPVHFVLGSIEIHGSVRVSEDSAADCAGSHEWLESEFDPWAIKECL
jgi:hypothetical protein